MAKGLNLTSVRLEKILNELKKEGYLLRQELIVCNTKEKFDTPSKAVLRHKGVMEGFLVYPLNKISMYFVCAEKGKIQAVHLVCRGRGSVCIEEEEFDFIGNIPMFLTDEEYVLFIGDDIPSDVDGEELVSFELLGKEPIFRELLESKGMLMQNDLLWSLFNDYDCQAFSDYRSKEVIKNIPNKFRKAIEYRISVSDFSLRETKMYGNFSVSVFCNSDNTASLGMYIDNGKITFWYFDRYSDKENIFKQVGISDIEGGRTTKASVFEGWKYKSRMLNNNINSAVFRFYDLDLDVLLKDLKREKYKIENIGVICVTSIKNCVVACGFANQSNRKYVVFYFDEEEGGLRIRLINSQMKKTTLYINDSVVPLNDILCNDVSTLIHGFDFEDFKEFELV